MAVDDVVQPADLHGPESLEITLPSAIDSVPAMRAAAREFARRHGVRQLDDVVLAVSEACTNVVMHAYDGQEQGAELRLAGRREGDRVYLTVQDHGHGMRRRRTSSGLGLGLAIMSATSRHLRIRETATGTQVELGFEAAG